MNMKCPNCQSEMVEGLIQANSNILFSKKKRYDVTFYESDEILVAKSGWSIFHFGRTTAFCCQSCKMILVPYKKEK